MPLYEFHCEKCGHDNEVLVPTPRWEGTPCPDCGSTRLVKKLSVFAAAGSDAEEGPACSGNPGACGRCHGDN